MSATTRQAALALLDISQRKMKTLGAVGESALFTDQTRINGDSSGSSALMVDGEAAAASATSLADSVQSSTSTTTLNPIVAALTKVCLL